MFNEFSYCWVLLRSIIDSSDICFFSVAFCIENNNSSIVETLILRDINIQNIYPPNSLYSNLDVLSNPNLDIDEEDIRSVSPTYRDAQNVSPIMFEDQDNISIRELEEIRNISPDYSDAQNVSPIIFEDQDNISLSRNESELRNISPTYRDAQNVSPIIFEDQDNESLLRNESELQNISPTYRDAQNVSPIIFREFQGNLPTLNTIVGQNVPLIHSGFQDNLPNLNSIVEQNVSRNLEQDLSLIDWEYDEDDDLQNISPTYRDAQNVSPIIFEDN